MSRINPEQSVIVFDLDDTLYAEYEYKCSGIRAVTALVAKLYPEFGETELLEKNRCGRQRVARRTLRAVQLQQRRKKVAALVLPSAYAGSDPVLASAKAGGIHPQIRRRRADYRRQEPDPAPEAGRVGYPVSV